MDGMTKRFVNVEEDYQIGQGEKSNHCLINGRMLYDKNNGFYLYGCQYRLEYFQSSLFAEHDIYLPEKINRSVKKRQAEFFAGRYCAKKILEILNFSNQPILTAKSRAPIWPKGLVASLSHNDKYAFCAAATSKQTFVRLGLDIESLMTPLVAKNTVNLVLNEREQHRLKKTHLSFTEGLTIIFSAKESLYKALYPEVNRYFDFLDVEVIDICEQHNKVELLLLKTLSTNLTIGTTFICRYYSINDSVLTIVN